MRNKRKKRNVINTLLPSGYELNYLMQDFYPTKTMQIPQNNAFAVLSVTGKWDGQFLRVPRTYWGHGFYVNQYGKDAMGYIDISINPNAFLVGKEFFFADFDNSGTVNLSNFPSHRYDLLRRNPAYIGILHYSQLTPEIVEDIRKQDITVSTAQANQAIAQPNAIIPFNVSNVGNTPTDTSKKKNTQYFIYAGVGLMAYLLYDKFVK